MLQSHTHTQSEDWILQSQKYGTTIDIVKWVWLWCLLNVFMTRRTFRSRQPNIISSAKRGATFDEGRKLQWRKYSGCFCNGMRHSRDMKIWNKHIYLAHCSHNRVTEIDVLLFCGASIILFQRLHQNYIFCNWLQWAMSTTIIFILCNDWMWFFVRLKFNRSRGCVV